MRTKLRKFGLAMAAVAGLLLVQGCNRDGKDFAFMYWWLPSPWTPVLRTVTMGTQGSAAQGVAAGGGQNQTAGGQVTTPTPTTGGGNQVSVGGAVP